MYGRVTKTRQGRKIMVNIPLYGFWNAGTLAILFPTYFSAGIPSQRMYGTSDTPMVLTARNGDQITINNVQLVKVTNLKLAANQQIFSADCTFVGLISNNTAPTAANAFYTIATAATFTETGFPDTEFKSLTWTGKWATAAGGTTGRTGFTSILTQDGWSVDWEIKTTDDLVDGIGPVDAFTDLFWATATAIPVGPTLAQLDTALDFQGTNAAVGADISADVGDLILTDGTSTLTLNACAVVDGGLVFGAGKKRIRATRWETTKLNFSSGIAPAMMAAT